MMELEPASNIAPPPPDKRPPMPEPPPVRVTAVEDVHVFARAGVETLLDDFYVGVLRFDRDCDFRDGDSEAESQIVYRAENVRLIFDILEPPVERNDLRPIMVEVPFWPEIEALLIESKMPYQRSRGLLPGQHAFVLQDPAGNWISISESRGVR